MNKINSTDIFSNLINEGEIKETLELFVSYGILMKIIENGEELYKENPVFNELSKEEQEEVFNKIKIHNHVPTQER